MPLPTLPAVGAWPNRAPHRPDLLFNVGSRDCPPITVRPFHIGHKCRGALSQVIPCFKYVNTLTKMVFAAPRHP